MQRDKITAIRAGDLFTWVINGGEEVVEGRKEKPDASVFHKACKMVGCEPSEAVHVGDSLSTDILGGQNAGLGAPPAPWESQPLTLEALGLNPEPLRSPGSLRKP